MTRQNLVDFNFADPFCQYPERRRLRSHGNHDIRNKKSRPFRVHWTYRYVQPQGQGYGHLPKYLVCDFIYQFFHSYMKKSSKSSLKKRSRDISLQH